MEIIEPEIRTAPAIGLVQQFREAILKLESLGLEKIVGKISAPDERLDKQLETLSLEDQQDANIVKATTTGDVLTQDTKRLLYLQQQLDNATLLRKTHSAL